MLKAMCALALLLNLNCARELRDQRSIGPNELNGDARPLEEPASVPATPSLVSVNGQKKKLIASSRKVQRGIYIPHHNYSKHFADTEATKQTLMRIVSLGFDTILPVVWNQACPRFKSETFDQMVSSSACDKFKFRDGWLDDLVKQSQSLGLKVVPWFEWGFKIPKNSDVEPILREKDWLWPGVNSSQYAYLDIKNKEDTSRDLLVGLMDDLLTQYPSIDTLHWDDHFHLRKEDFPDNERSDLDYTLSRFANSLALQLKAKRKVRLEMEHFHPSWGKSKYAVDWEAWSVWDELIIQAYVPGQLKQLIEGELSSLIDQHYAGKRGGKAINTNAKKPFLNGYALLIGEGTNTLSDSKLETKLQTDIGIIKQFDTVKVYYFNFDAIDPSQDRLISRNLSELD